MKGTVSSANARERWEEALSVIRSRISRQSFEAWFRPLPLGPVENNRIHVLLPNRFFQEGFEEHYLGRLSSALEDLMFTTAAVPPPLPDKETPPGVLVPAEPARRRASGRARDTASQFN